MFVGRRATILGPLVPALVCVSLGLVPEPAFSQKAPAPSAKPDLERLKRALETGDEAAKLAALSELASVQKSSAPAAAELVNALLGRGASLPVVERCLETAQALAQSSSSPAIAPYARHRQPGVRRAAVRALGVTGGPVAVTTLRAALRGSDAALRREAASGLAMLQAGEAVSDLFAVLAKDVPEAARAIGELCTPAECGKFAELLGKLPFDVMRTGLEPILLRPESAVPEEPKLQILERLRKLQTGEASAFLKSVLARYPKEGSARVRAGLEAAASGRPVTKPKP